MSIETLLTLAVAGGILVLASILRLLALGGIKAARAVTGHPAPRAKRPVELGDAVAGRSWTERTERIGRLGAGIGAVVVFLIATVWTWTRAVGGAVVVAARWVGRNVGAGWLALSRWWRGAAHPVLEETREATLALMTTYPESSGRLDVMERMSPEVTNGNGSRRSEEARDMQLV